MMDRTDVLALAKKAWDDFFASPPPKDVLRYIVRMTSGTTGGTPLFLLNRAGELESDRFVGTEDILLCMGSLSVRLAHVCHMRRQSLAEGHPMHMLVLSAGDLSPALTSLLADFSPDLVYGFPPFIVRMAEYVDEETGRSVRGIGLGGERVTPVTKQSFEKVFPNATLKMRYIATEVGAIGMSCGNLPPNLYHPAPGVTVELEDVDESGAGQLLVSKQVNERLPVDKYRIGDTVRILPEYACPCGAPVTFEHLGRSGFDYMKLSGGLVRRDELDRVTVLFGKYIADYRAEVGEVMDGGVLKGKILLRIYGSQGIPTSDLVEEIARDMSQKLFVTATNTLTDLVKKGAFVPLELHFSAEPFPQGNKEVKLRRIQS